MEDGLVTHLLLDGVVIVDAVGVVGAGAVVAVVVVV